MELHNLGHLLHLFDPTLPIGGYTHSNGMETYVQNSLVNNKSTAHKYVEHMLRYNMKYNDAAFVSLAYEACRIQDMDELIALDQECSALKAPKEIRQASKKLGLRLIKIFKRKIENQFLSDYEKMILSGVADTHYCVVFGLIAHLLHIPKKEALYAYYYNAAVGMVTNAVKLVPLGQLDGQDIIFSMNDLLEQLTSETLALDRNLVGLCNVAFDIRCMQHERLYSRLYMS